MRMVLHCLPCKWKPPGALGKERTWTWTPFVLRTRKGSVSSSCPHHRGMTLTSRKDRECMQQRIMEQSEVPLHISERVSNSKPTVCVLNRPHWPRVCCPVEPEKAARILRIERSTRGRLCLCWGTKCQKDIDSYSVHNEDRIKPLQVMGLPEFLHPPVLRSTPPNRRGASDLTPEMAGISHLCWSESFSLTFSWSNFCFPAVKHTVHFCQYHLEKNAFPDWCRALLCTALDVFAFTKENFLLVHLALIRELRGINSLIEDHLLMFYTGW